MIFSPLFSVFAFEENQESPASIGHVFFTGYEYDGDTGLSYMNARYYNGKIGRFVSQDPVFLAAAFNLADPQSLNSYAYARNNPLVNIDPDGRSVKTFLQGVGTGIVGAVVVTAVIASAPVTISAAVLTGAAVVGIGLIGYSTYENYKAYTNGSITKDQFDYNAGSLFGGLLAPAKIGKLGGTAEVGSRIGKESVSPIDYYRPKLWKSTVEEINVNAPRTADGKPIDPNTLMPIEGKPDIGHKYGQEYRRQELWAKIDGLTQKQFNERMNNPSLYQLEDPVSNRGHKFEKPGID